MITILVSLLVVSVIIAGNSIAGGDNGFTEPPETSGDGEPDGSGIYESNGLNFGPGPAPNSGDGIPDGPGW